MTRSTRRRACRSATSRSQIRLWESFTKEKPRKSNDPWRASTIRLFSVGQRGQTPFICSNSNRIRPPPRAGRHGVTSTMIRLFFGARGRNGAVIHAEDSRCFATEIRLRSDGAKGSDSFLRHRGPHPTAIIRSRVRSSSWRTARGGLLSVPTTPRPPRAGLRDHGP